MRDIQSAGTKDRIGLCRAPLNIAIAMTCHKYIFASIETVLFCQDCKCLAPES